MRPPPAPAIAAIFLALHAAPFVGARCAWGVDALAGCPAGIPLAFLALSALLLVPASRRGALASLARVPDSWRPPLAAGIAVATFVALPSAIPILGDGALHLRDLAAIAAQDVPFSRIVWGNNNAPLANAVVYALQRHASPPATFRILAVGSGVLYVLLAWGAARHLGRDAAQRDLILGALLTAGYVQIFAGYVELYAPLIPLLLAFLLAGARAASRGDAPWLAAVVLGVAIPMHLVAVTFAPAVAVAAWSSGGGRTARSAARAAACVAVTALVSGIALAAVGFDPAGVLRSKGAHFLPLLAEPGFRHNYRLLDPRHFLDLANQYLLVAPAAVMGLPLLRRAGPDRTGPFLVVAAVVPAAFTAIVNPEVGPFRDWDALSFAAVPLTLAVAVRLARSAGAGLVRTAFVLVAASCLHTLAWLGVNADAAAAEARFTRLLESCGRSRHALAYGRETLGSHFLRAGRIDEASDAFERAAAASPANPRLWNLAGQLHLRGGRIDRAAACFERALRQDERLPDTWLGLGSVWLARGDEERAREALRRFLALEPTGPRADEVRRRLGP